jgi:hypothetical protein
MVHCVVIIATLCGSNIGLWNQENEQSKVSILLTEKSIIFMYDELQNRYCFTNLNQLYVDYIYFG